MSFHALRDEPSALLVVDQAFSSEGSEVCADCADTQLGAPRESISRDAREPHGVDTLKVFEHELAILVSQCVLIHGESKEGRHEP